MSPFSLSIAGFLLAVALFIRAAQNGSVQAALDALQTNQNDEYGLQGNFAPINTTIFVACIKPTEGKLPAQLDGGMFARVGPNPYSKETHYHWFDGQGMVHAVKINAQENCVNYTNDFMRTPRMAKEKELSWNSHLRLGNMRGVIGLLRVLIIEPLYSFLGLVIENKLMNGVANTALVFFHGKLFSLVENNLPWQVQIEKDGALTSLTHFTFGNKWPHPTSAHIKHDVNTDELILYAYQIDKKPHVVTGVANSKGEIISGPLGIDIPYPVMMHDNAITEHFTIIMNLPFVFDPTRMVRGSPFVFRSDLNSRFGLQPRHATNQSEIKWFDALPCFVFHTANAWEEKTENGEDVVVLVAFRYPNITLEFAEMAQHTAQANDLYEWRFNLHTGKTTEKRVEGAPSGEFPTVNKKFLGRKSRFAYYPTNGEVQHFPKLNGLVKMDLSTGKVLHHHVYGSGVFGGELSFAPGTGGAEDDGYLTGYLHDEARGVSSFLVLNAKNLTQEARVELPGRVPFGFHGTFITAEELSE